MSLSPLLLNTDTFQCPHAGTGTILTMVGVSKISKIGSAFFVTGGAVVTIVGCTFAPGGIPSPCVTGVLTSFSKHVMDNGINYIIVPSTGIVGIAYNATQVPQGNLTAITTNNFVKSS